MRLKKQSGFTLIETIIAIMIAGMAFAVLTQAFVNILLTLSSLKSENSRQGDIRFVRSQIIQEANLETFEEGGEIETMDMGEARWNVYVEPTDIVDLFRVELEIEFENPLDDEAYEHQEIIYLLRPSWSDPIERSTLLSERRDDIEEEALRREW